MKEPEDVELDLSLRGSPPFNFVFVVGVLAAVVCYLQASPA